MSASFRDASEGVGRGPNFVVAIASTTIAITLSTIARADQTSIAWEAPAGCPTQVDVERAVAQLREGKPPPVRSVQARGSVTQPPGERPRLDLSLVTPEARSDRVIEGDTCGELVGAAALLIVLATDGGDEPPAALPASPPRREPPPTPPPAPPPNDKEPAAAPAGESVPPFDLGVRAFVAVDAAALPKPAPGFGAGAGLQKAAWRGELFGAYFPDQTQLVGSGGAGADISLMLAAARFCWVPLRRRFELGGCVGGEVGLERALGFGVSDPGSGNAAWVAPQLALVGHLHITPVLAGVAGIDFAVPVAKERFILVGVGDVHGAPDVTGRLVLGIEIGP